GEQVGELLVCERLAQRREHGSGVLERLLIADTLPFGYAGDELVQRHPLRSAAGPLLASGERRAQLLRQLLCEVVALAARDALRERLEDRLAGAMRLRNPESSTTGDPLGEHLDGDHLRRSRIAPSAGGVPQQPFVFAWQLRRQAGDLLAPNQPCESDED